MSFAYAKKDPGDTGQRRWMTRVKIGQKEVTVSLRLRAPDSKRIAQQRAVDLQMEADAGLISARTQEWLGEDTYAKLAKLIAQATLESLSGSPETWQAACDAYLESCRAKDTKYPVPNSARTVNRTLRFRHHAINRIARWMIENQVSFQKTAFTTALMRYIEDRKNSKIKPNTLWGSDYGMGVPWGEWLHAKGLCEKPNREKIQEIMPRKVTPVIMLPSPSEDIAGIRFFRDHREDLVMRPDTQIASFPHLCQIDRRSSRRNWSAWSLVLCVRGLGCRPSEASTLMWQTVDLAKGIVHLMDTKTGFARKVPILFRWVHDGLVELRDKFPNQSALCCSTDGKPWGDDVGMSACIRQIAARYQGVPYPLKQAQKLHIAQLITSGFPPRVVAKWTGHTLSVQERHYCEDLSYLPSDHEIDYGEFGTLTDWGHKVKKHLSGFVNDGLDQ